MKKMVSILFFLVLVSVNSFAGTEETGAWSEPVDGLRGRLIAKEGSAFHGTRMVDIYLELENVSNVGNPMQFYFDPIKSIESRCFDPNGKDLIQPPTAADVITPSAYWLSIPNDGKLKFKISVTGYGVYENSGTNIKPGDKSKYYLEAKLISHPPESSRIRAWSGELKFPKVLIPHS
jgi:hypothetical protein